MITSIIFSKNRPLQLDLCLKSIKKNFPQSTQNIVLHNNSIEFSRAHLKLEKEHQDVEFWQQSESLFCDIWEAAKEAKNDYICFFVDDCIVYNRVALPQIEFFNNPIVSCFSLRLGMNACERSHEEFTVQDKPTTYKISDCGSYMMVHKTMNVYGSYWSYDLSVDGHIFRKKDMEEMSFELWKVSQFKDWKQTPNEFEGALQRFWTNTPLMMICPFQSAVVNSPNNKTQTSHPNRHGDVYSYNENLLLQKYEDGDRISIEDINFENIKCPHTEIDILKGLK